MAGPDDDAPDAPDTPFLREAKARLDALPPGFTRWIDDMPPWPDGVPEIHGPPDEMPEELVRRLGGPLKPNR